MKWRSWQGAVVIFGAIATGLAEPDPARAPEVAEILGQARDAAKAGDYKKAAELLKKEAEAGDAVAAFGLAELYLGGTGVEKSAPDALKWYAQAGDAGNAMALFRQGEIYLRGMGGVERDEDRGRFLVQSAAEAGVADAWTMLGEVYDAEAKAADAAPKREELFGRAREHFRKAAEAGSLSGQRKYASFLDQGLGGAKDERGATTWLRKAAIGGLADAMNELGMRYQSGTGVEADPINALGWFLAAAERGSLPGMTNLGLCYAKGIGVPPNFDGAGAWYAKASRQGFSSAQYLLGQLFENGQGTEKNVVFAYINYVRAANQGLAPAAQARDALAKRLTEAQRAQAEKILATPDAPNDGGGGK